MTDAAPASAPNTGTDAPAGYVPLDERERGYTAVELSAETLAHDLCRNLVDMLLSQKKPLAEQSAIEQEQRITWLRDQCRLLVRKALDILVSGDHAACAAIISGISIADDITVKLTIPADSRGRHDLIDMRKRAVVLVMANPEEYLRKLDEVKGRAAQGDLFPLIADAKKKTLEQDEITDSMIIESLVTFGIDVRPPVWATLRENVQHAARELYRVLDANPVLGDIPDLLQPYVIGGPLRSAPGEEAGE